MSWTDERIATLKKMWLQGKSASEIAEKLGGVTRNAVIGKAHRLNLSGRPSPIKKVTTAPVKKPAAAAPAVKKPVAAKPAPAPKAAPVETAAPASQQKAQQQPQRSGNGPGKPPEVVQLAALANATSRPDGGTISILELSEKNCRWPVGDPRETTFGYCGNDSYGAHPYCAEHVAIAFQAPNRKDKRPVKNVKEAEAVELEDLEVEVEDEEDIEGDDTLVEDDLDDDTPLVV